MAEQALDKKSLISLLTTSPHGDLRQYAAVAIPFAMRDPEFYAHTLVYNHRKGQVRDAKVALPVIALANPSVPRVAQENALALIADLPPRLFLQAMEFAKQLRDGWDMVEAVRGDDKKGIRARPVIPACAAMPIPFRRLLRRLRERYMRDLEANWPEWERNAVRDRATMTALYGKFHVECGGSPHNRFVDTLFGPTKKTPDRVRPSHGKFAVVRQLPNLSALEIGGFIAKYQIPFTVARGALGAKAKDPDVLLALINAMTDTELVTNMRALKRLGVQSVPALRGALELRIEKAGGKKRKPKATLKTTRAAEALADDVVMSTKLHALQERQLDNLGSVDGSWLIIADKSGSMETAIETANQIAAVLARMAKQVTLVYVDTHPRMVDATGKTYEQLKAATAMMTAGGGTSLGCGLDYALQHKIEVDGIAVVSDGCENHAPYLGDVYDRYSRFVDKAVPVYFYRVDGGWRSMLQTQARVHYKREPTAYEYAGAERQINAELSEFRLRCASAKLVLDEFDLTGGTDFYALPNLIGTMKTNRYSFLDSIMAQPLVTLDAVLDRTRGMKVLAEEQPVHA